MPTFAIAKLFALSGPPNPGVVSEATEVPVTDIECCWDQNLNLLLYPFQ